MTEGERMDLGVSIDEREDTTYLYQTKKLTHIKCAPKKF